MSEEFSTVKPEISFLPADPLPGGVENVPILTRFVQKEQVIAVMAMEEPTDEKRMRYALLPAANTILSKKDDELSLVASVNGYPQVNEKKKGKVGHITVSVVPMVSFSSDKMFAMITLYPECGETGISEEEIVKVLKDEGVIVGIDHTAILQAVKKRDEENCVVTDVIVARGTLPLHGKDAYFRFEMDIGPVAGTELGNGRIDFRERKVFVGVEEGQLIATKVPFTEGTPGKNIFGDMIAQKPGKDIKVVVSGDVEFSLASNEVRARLAGILSVTNNINIKVQAKQVISGDVDFETGNIESKNSVEISGSVKPGFSVQARGDVAVGGNIQDSFVETKGNVVVRGGLIGEKSRVKARGDVDIVFTERGYIYSGGTVLVRKQSYYSTILSDGSIHCNEGSIVLGGLLLCGGNFSCATVGSGNAEAGIIGAGIFYNRYRLLLELRQEIDELEEKITKLLQLKGENVREETKCKGMEDELTQLKKRVDRLNLIPGTPEESRNEPFMNRCEATIDIHGSVITGTQIRIGNAMLNLDKDYIGVGFFLDETQQYIEMKKI